MDDEINDKPLLNSKGKPYKNGRKPDEKTLEKLRLMRERAKQKLNEKSQQTRKEKIIYDKVKEKELSKYMKEKQKRNAIVNKLVEDNLDKQQQEEEQQEQEQIEEQIEEVVEKKKKPKKVIRRIVYESSSEEEEEIIVKRKPKVKNKIDNNHSYQELLKLNSDRLIQEKLLKSQINEYQKSMSMMRF